MLEERQGSLITFAEAYTEPNNWDKLKYWIGHTNWSSWWSRAHGYCISAYEWCAVSIHFAEVFNGLPQSLSMIALFNANASNLKLCRSIQFSPYTNITQAKMYVIRLGMTLHANQSWNRSYSGFTCGQAWSKLLTEQGGEAYGPTLQASCHYSEEDWAVSFWQYFAGETECRGSMWSQHNPAIVNIFCCNGMLSATSWRSMLVITNMLLSLSNGIWHLGDLSNQTSYSYEECTVTDPAVRIPVC